MFVEQSTQEFRVLLVVSTADLANTVEGTECAGVSLSSEHHHLLSVDLNSNVLVRQRHKGEDQNSLCYKLNIDVITARI